MSGQYLARSEPASGICQSAFQLQQPALQIHFPSRSVATLSSETLQPSADALDLCETIDLLEGAMRKTGSRGFTLVEVMVVVVILAVLAALVVPRVVGRTDEARVVAAKQDIASIMQSLKLYRIDNSRYPTNDQGLEALVTRPSSGPQPTNWKSYLDKLPKDPWGRPYLYLSPGVHGEIDVFSLGADGQPGGSGADSDVGSWDL